MAKELILLKNAIKEQKSRRNACRYQNFAYLCTRNPKETRSVAGRADVRCDAKR